MTDADRIEKIVELIGQLPMAGDSATDSGGLARLFAAVAELRARVREQSPDIELPNDIVLEEATPHRSG